jgi:hypothetical protein
VSGRVDGGDGVTVGGHALVVPNVKHNLSVGIPNPFESLTIIVAVAALSLDLVKGPDWGWGNGKVIAFWAVVAAAAGLFCLINRRAAEPVVDLAMFRSRVFASANAGIVLVSAAIAVQPGHVSATGSAVVQMGRQMITWPGQYRPATWRGAANNQGALAIFFTGLASEIEADRKTLDKIAASLGTQPSTLKQAAAVGAERLCRFKIDHRMTGSPELSRLLELELLYLGIEDKHTLWRSWARCVRVIPGWPSSTSASSSAAPGNSWLPSRSSVSSPLPAPARPEPGPPTAAASQQRREIKILFPDLV